MASEDWYKGKFWGRGELAKEMLRSVFTEPDEHGRVLISINRIFLEEVAKLADKPHGK